MTRPATRPVVRVEPLGVEIEVHAGETLIDAAWREGYYWPTVCYGQAECMSCNVLVLEGAGNLSDVGADEDHALRSRLRAGGQRNIDNRRLACQVEVHGPATVEKPGVRPPP